MVGCETTQPLYHRGRIEDATWTSLAKPGQVAPEQRILWLEQDIVLAQSKGLPLPPGFYAELGSLYYQMGREPEARAAWREEMLHYPESEPFMLRLLGSPVPE